MPPPRRGLPAPTAAFCDKKDAILRQLAVPDDEYADASPKGSVDAGIRSLIDDVNHAEGFVTTSSCAGRVSVFLEGRRWPVAAAAAAAEEEQQQQQQQHLEQSLGQRASVGGKGAGGTWLYVSHEPIPQDGQHGRAGWLDVLGYDESAVGLGSFPVDEPPRLIRFKFEPMILHVLTASAAHAQTLLGAGLQAGFRESGAVSLMPPRHAQPATPLVAIRSLGLGFESLIGYAAPDGRRRWLVSADVLETLRAVAQERFSENARRVQRFRAAFLDAVAPPAPALGRDWEDAAVRRERKRAEGLRRKAASATEGWEDAVTDRARDRGNVPDSPGVEIFTEEEESKRRG